MTGILQRKPTTALVVLTSLITLVLTLGAILLSGVHPRTLIYAFIMTYLGQLILIHFMTGIHHLSRGGPMACLLEKLSRPPRRDERSIPLVAESSNRPMGLGGYLVVLAVLSFLAFIFTHVNDQHRLEFSWKVFGDELSWAMILTFFYLIQDLVSRSLVIDFSVSPEINMGYNQQETWILGCAGLIAGIVVVIRQTAGLDPTGWVLLGPLVALRHIADLQHDLASVVKARSSDR